MAGALERLYGTEEDKVNCPFFIKIGACRYENKCQRIHSIPPISQTILFKHMYQNSPIEVAIATGNKVPQEKIEQALEKFENFYEDVFLKLADFGEVEDMIVCENIVDHLVGNVYVKFTTEEFAERCFNSLQNMQYEGRPLMMEYSPVIDFTNAKCKQFIEGTCQRGGSCNYMHLKKIGSKYKKSLFKQMYEEHPEYMIKKKKKSKSRSRSEKKKLKKSKKKSKKESNSDHTSRKNSIERQNMIAEWNETGIMNVGTQVIEMYNHQNLPAPVYQPKVNLTTPELLQLQLQLAALKEQLALAMSTK